MNRTKLIFYLILAITALVLLKFVYIPHRNRREESTPAPTPLLSATVAPGPTSSPTVTSTYTPPPTVTSTYTPSPTGTPAPEFVEDCNQTPSEEWLVYGNGTFVTIDDRCLFLPTYQQEQNLALVGFPFWRDYVVDVDVHYTRDDKDDYCGIIVLAQDDRNYMRFSMGGRGQNIGWWINQNDDLTLVPGTEQGSALKDNTRYHVRIEVSGGNIITNLDSQEVARFGTRISTSGAIGVFAYSDGASPRDLCAFDNIRVSPLQR